MWSECGPKRAAAGVGLGAAAGNTRVRSGRRRFTHLANVVGKDGNETGDADGWKLVGRQGTSSNTVACAKPCHGTETQELTSAAAAPPRMEF